MKNKFCSLVLIVFIVTFFFNLNTYSQDGFGDGADIIDEESSVDAQQRRLETFEIVWQTINDNYFDRTFSGLDWKKIKAEYLPQAKNAKTDAELHLILQKMISRLERSHFGIIPPEVFKAIEEAKQESVEQGQEITEEFVEDTDSEDQDVTDEEIFDYETLFNRFGIGIDLRLFEDKFVITEVEKDSAAEKVGLKAGYILESINGVSLKEFKAAISTDYEYVKAFDKKLPVLLIEWFLNGEKDSYVQVNVLDENNQPKSFTMKRQKIVGEYVTILKDVPEQYLKFETKSINQEIGYIKFNFFALPIIEKFCASITEFKDKKALIIDLRGNQGGLMGSVMGLTGFLTNKKINLGTEYSRKETMKREITPHAKNFKGKTYILIDNLSYSAAEMLAAALKENDLATVIGQNSAGEALPSLTKALPTGAVFMFPVANFKTPKGNSLEGVGVSPDFEVSLKRESLLKGKDDQLDAAIDIASKRIIKAESEASKNPTTIKKNVPPPPPPKVKTGISARRTTVNKLQQIKALRVIDDFIEASGGREVLEAINNFQANGKLELKRSGAVVEGEVELVWDSPNKYLENYFINGAGKISEIFDGKKLYVESEFTGTQEDYPPKVLEDKALNVGFYEILKMRDFYTRIVHRGIYTVAGRKVNLIEATTSSGITNAFNFDVQTKMLSKRVSIYTGIVEYDDYRSVDDKILLPFIINKGETFTFTIDQYTINGELDKTLFNKKVSCFDVVD